MIFAQERVGRDGEPFRVFKLRTMVVDAEARKAELAEHNEADGPMFKMADDPRVTRVGALLRKLSIDEIPQFVNVLRGEMSVVGPRPALAVRGRAVDRRRPRSAPGAPRASPGMWQVSGRSDTTFDEYKRLDLYYVDNWSLAHDLRIVLQTFSAVLRRRVAPAEAQQPLNRRDSDARSSTTGGRHTRRVDRWYLDSVRPRIRGG